MSTMHANVRAMSILWIDPFGGMAGDMFLAALLDLEDPRFGLDDLVGFVRGFLPDDCSLVSEDVLRGSLRGRLLHVRSSETEDPPHRHLSDLVALVEQSGLGQAAQERACAVLRRIAVAEAEVHGSEPEKVHFHEVGAVDTAVDVGGALFALERLEVQRVLSTAPYVGGGTVRCAHGVMPVPAPGTAAILGSLPHRRGPGGERLTPTGAALLAELVEGFDVQVDWTVGATGYGAGLREPQEGPPNLMRVQLGEEAPGVPAAEVTLLEFNLDDMTGEEVGFLVGQLRTSGALEVWSTPVQMKKDRPGVVLSMLCRHDRRAELEEVALRHSSTLGLRWTSWKRTECPRRTLVVQVEGQEVRVVQRLGPAGTSSRFDLSPEYDDLAALTRATGKSLADLEAEVLRQAWQQAEANPLRHS